MSQGSIKKVVIITTRDNYEYIVNYSMKEWNKICTEEKNAGENKIYLKDYDCNLYFHNIKSEKGKVLHLSLPEPKQETPFFLLGSNEKQEILKENPQLYYKLKKEEEEGRKKIAEGLRKIGGVTLEKRKKSFLEKREEILKRLAFEEKELGFQTTISKLDELDKFKKQEIKNII